MISKAKIFRALARRFAGLVPLVLVLAGFSSCRDLKIPDGKLQCSTQQPSCPSPYLCMNGLCYAPGHVPDAAPSDVGQDADKIATDARPGLDTGLDAGLDGDLATSDATRDALPGQLDAALDTPSMDVPSGDGGVDVSGSTDATAADLSPGMDVAQTPAMITLSAAAGSSRDFGAVHTDQTADQTYLVANIGTQSSSAVSLNLQGSKEFSLLVGAPDDCVTGNSLAGGATCKIRVRFGTTTRGKFSTMLSAKASVGGTATLNLTGAGPLTAVAIAMGYEYRCVLFDTGQVNCWGRNYAGMLGTGDMLESKTPKAIALPPGRVATSLSVGDGNSACAILDDGSAVCWGNNVPGQAVAGSSSLSLAPIAVPGQHAIKSIAAGSETLVLTEAGQILVWGNQKATPDQIPLAAGEHAAQVARYGRHSCLLLETGTMECWGENNDGELGNGTSTASSSPIQPKIPDGETVVGIGTAAWASCALAKSGNVFCWGDFFYDLSTHPWVPTKVEVPVGVKGSELAVGRQHACIRSDLGEVFCWGSNFSGMFGNGTTDNSRTAVKVLLPAGTKANRIFAGYYNTCAVLDTQDLACWGDSFANFYGNVRADGSPLPVVFPINFF